MKKVYYTINTRLSANKWAQTSRNQASLINFIKAYQKANGINIDPYTLHDVAYTATPLKNYIAGIRRFNIKTSIVLINFWVDMEQTDPVNSPTDEVVNDGSSPVDDGTQDPTIPTQPTLPADTEDADDSIIGSISIPLPTGTITGSIEVPEPTSPIVSIDNQSSSTGDSTISVTMPVLDPGSLSNGVETVLQPIVQVTVPEASEGSTGCVPVITIPNVTVEVPSVPVVVSPTPAPEPEPQPEPEPEPTPDPEPEPQQYTGPVDFPSVEVTVPVVVEVPVVVDPIITLPTTTPVVTTPVVDTPVTTTTPATETPVTTPETPTTGVSVGTGVSITVGDTTVAAGTTVTVTVPAATTTPTQTTTPVVTTPTTTTPVVTTPVTTTTPSTGVTVTVPVVVPIVTTPSKPIVVTVPIVGGGKKGLFG